MKQLFILSFLFFSATVLVKAQTLKGIVMDLNTSSPISQVEIHNIATKEIIRTNSSGEFSLKIKLNELLSFHYPGYRVDTLVVTNYEFRRIYMSSLANSIILKDVKITELSDAQLNEQIEITKQQGKIVGVPFGGGITISPSRLFGKTAKEARARHDLLIAEREDRAIMAKFNPLLITSLTPLKGRDLDLFIVKYKPSYTFITSSDEEQIRLYIMDSFKEYNTLSAEEKDRIKLTKDNLK